GHHGVRIELHAFHSDYFFWGGDLAQADYAFYGPLVGPGRFRSALGGLSRAQGRFHDLAVEMPSRMGERRQHHREPNEKRQRADRQGDGDEEPPGRHHQRIAKDRSDRRVHRDHRADIPIQQQREGNDADRQHQDSEQKTDAVSGDDEDPTFRRG